MLGEGVKANLPVGRNGGWNQNIKRGDEIVESKYKERVGLMWKEMSQNLTTTSR